jgi:hypothetical protein
LPFVLVEFDLDVHLVAELVVLIAQLAEPDALPWFVHVM